MWPALEAFLAELDATDASAIVREHRGTNTVVLRGSRTAAGAGAPLPVEVALDADACGVAITILDWTERFRWPAADDDDDDGESLAIDLVAAALLGYLRVRVRVRLHGAAPPLGRDFVFATARGPILHRTWRRWRWPWQRAATVVLANAASAPKGYAQAPVGVVPRAPWSGTLHTPMVAVPAALAIDGELDLHPFSPRDVKPLVLEYIDVCKQRGIVELRIVHGKGIGALRRTVHAILAEHPDVASFRLGGMGEGSWGATLVTLRPLTPAGSASRSRHP